MSLTPFLGEVSYENGRSPFIDKLYQFLYHGTSMNEDIKLYEQLSKPT